MSLSAEDLAALEASEEIVIETRAGEGAPIHRTIVWVVTDGPDAFIRSVNGAQARWYTEATAHPEIIVDVADRRIPVRAIPAADERSVERTSAALLRKYAADPDAPSMLFPETLATTLRLEPG